jgi:hypothetical protein
MFRYAIVIAAALLASSCATRSPCVEGERVNFRVSALGDNLREMAFHVPVEGNLTHIQVLRQTSGGDRETVWSSHGTSDIASLNAHGFRESIGYGLDHDGLVQDNAASPLRDGHIYIVYVTVVDSSGKELRGGTVFVASDQDGVSYHCDSVEQCSAYLLSEIT